MNKTILPKLPICRHSEGEARRIAKTRKTMRFFTIAQNNVKFLGKLIITAFMFVLLSSVVAAATGRDFNDYLEEGQTYLEKYKMYNMQTHLETALYNLKQAESIDPVNVELLIGLSEIYGYKNQFNQSRAYILKALNLDYNSAKTNFYMGEFLFNAGEFSKAADFYKKAETNGYDKNVATLIKLANTYEKLGDFPNAKKYLRKCAALTNNDREIIMKMKRLQHAIEPKKEFETFKEPIFDDL